MLTPPTGKLRGTCPLDPCSILLEMRCHRLHVPLRSARPSQEGNLLSSRDCRRPWFGVIAGSYRRLPRRQHNLLLGLSFPSELLPEPSKYTLNS